MEIRIRSTGQVVSDTEFRAAHAAILPTILTAEVLDENGADPVLNGAQPVAGEFQRVVRDGEEQNAFGWFSKYIVEDWSQEEIDAYHASGKLAAWEAIKAERDRRKAAGVLVGEQWFHSDDSSRIQYGILNSKAMCAGWGDTVLIHQTWKTMGRNADGSAIYAPMTVGLLRQILDAGIAQEQAIFNKAEEHKAAMEAASNPAAYDFAQDEAKTKWPAIYGE